MLYEENPVCLVLRDGCDLRLWLPLVDAAAPRLNLTEAGASLHRVYAREGSLLANAFGMSFYDSFIAALEARAAASLGHTLWRWEAGAYDWRLSLPDIASRGARLGARVYFEDATSTPYLEEKLRVLASSSPSGKVTIVAHSNGGLVAKELMQRLGNDAAARLIDKLVLVAVPQGGAPRAVASLMFGEGEAIPEGGSLAGFLLSPAHARAFARNSPMAYHLLPSASFLAAHPNPDHPLLTIGSGAVLAALRDALGSSIDTWAAFKEFALGRADGREQPGPDDLAHAAVLNPTLLTYAESEHARLDAWQPPRGVRVYEIAGNGVPTLSGISFYEQPVRERGIASTTIAYRPLFRSDGDGTVPLASALMLASGDSVETYTIDLPSASDEAHWFTHGTIFEVPEVERLISRILLDSPEESIAAHPGTVELVASTDDDMDGELEILLHGNARLVLRDAQNRITSVDASGVHRGIRGSTGGTMGNVSYVLVPAHGTYKLSIAESQDDYVTLDIERHEGDVLISRSTIASIALGKQGEAHLEINGVTHTLSALDLDSNGDGVNDASVIPQEEATVFLPEPPIASHDMHTNSPSAIAPTLPPSPRESSIGIPAKDGMGEREQEATAFRKDHPQPAATPSKAIQGSSAPSSEDPRGVVPWQKRLLRFALHLLEIVRAWLAAAFVF